MSSHEKLILTWASGENFCRLDYFQVFINSFLRNVAEDVLMVIFTNDMPVDIRCNLPEDRIVIQDIDNSFVEYVQRDRFLAYWKYLTNSDATYVLAVDSKDVLFQRDPFEWRKHPRGHAYLIAEGMQLSASGFNLADQFQFQADIREQFRTIDDHTKEVINSGVIFGHNKKIAYISMLIWTNMIKTFGSCTDQSCLNYLADFLIDDNEIEILDPIGYPFCLTGEAVKQGFIDVDFDGGKFKSQGREYFIVHQWERTVMRDEILEQYLGGSK